MLVKHMKEFLSDKNEDRDIVWAYTGESISMEEIGLTVIEEQEIEELDLFSDEA